MACRFPGAPSADELWRVLVAGEDTTTQTPGDRYDVEALYSADAGPGRIRARRAGYVEGVGEFDAEFFGLSPTEAAELDPQARLLLMSAWDALEDAGQRTDRLAGKRVGVFVGNTRGDYLELQLRQGLEAITPALLHNYRPMLAGRLSHAFDFRGPSVLVDTACSSSLSAVHLAVQSIRAGESPLAIAAGVNLALRPDEGVLLTQAGTLARDGRSKFGDAGADGYSPSDGVGVVILKPLAAALADGDRVRAVIRGSAVSNDGRSGDSLLNPSLLGQVDVLKWAYEDAGVSPADVDFVEAHGTGSPSLDPAELTAVGNVLGAGRPAGRPCFVGSVKTNIGHSEAAGGMAGLIKTVLCMEHEVLPASLHHDAPHPAVDWERLPVQVPDKCVDLTGRGRPLLAGVSGQGATCLNAHLVIGQGQTRAVNPQALPPAGGEATLLTLSARSPQALEDLTRAYVAYLRPGGTGAVLPLSDICYSAATRRQHHEYRTAVVGSTHADMVSALTGGHQAPVHDRRAAALTAIGERYRHGWTPPWAEVFPLAGRYVPLPQYPWQLRRYWTGEDGTPQTSAGLATRMLGKHARTAYSEDTLLSDVGIDSMAKLSIVVQLAGELGHDVDIDDLAVLRTVGAFQKWVGDLEAKTA
jgi:acyl transferase domain-containing protein